MTGNTLNLLLRFLLELAALGGRGLFGSRQATGALGYVLGLCVPLLAAAAWGIFAVPGDPSRSGHAPVPVPGWLRLALEAAFFAFGAYGYFFSGARWTALLLVGATLLHYSLAFARIRWLLQR